MHSNNSISKITSNYLLALIPLLLYGFYKNGILPYQYFNKKLYTLFKPLILPFMAFFLANILDKLFKNNKDTSFNPLLAIMSVMIIPINCPTLLYIFLLIIILFITQYTHLNINYALIPKIIIALYLYIFSSYTYLNNYEITSSLYYSNLDYFFGRSSGGLAATNSALCLLSYIFLCNTSIYKKEIPPLIIGSFLLLSLAFIPIHGIDEVYHRILNSTIIFNSIFLATMPMFSPITKKEIIIYSLFIGLTSSLLVQTLNIYESSYLVLLLAPYVLKIYRNFRQFIKKKTIKS